ncbi:HEPN domain-containing protein [Methylomonas sp. SURF-2]|uniref:HEPN domain-containing protein n=1 Tax=Methylomonas subterranea TaxID=2952225 RepID=A0ABT1TCV0_9GAMM|nr:HEPN domain-containing protein [Methylomonas sp. SURF-2]MCQ8103119.1 HEPN domain-containing protein [Methylomonas sp. SURF-2]
MSVKWKKSKSLKPELILGKVKDLIFLDGDQKTFRGGLEIEFALSALETMIDFSEEYSDKSWLISQVLRETINLDNKDDFIKNLEAKLIDQGKKPESVFHVLTSLSISSNYIKEYRINDCVVKLVGSEFEGEFHNSRVNALEGQSDDGDFYNKIVVITKSKSPSWAMNKALRSLDLLRSILCLKSNVDYELVGNEWKPINRIRLGPFHTVHQESGEVVTNGFWSEPFYFKAPFFDPWKDVKFDEDTDYILNRLRISKYANKLENALLRYVEALDERNHNNAVIKLWGAIECLVCPSGANGDLVTKRCSFLFKESLFHRQVLEHLREYRNNLVHAGVSREEVKSICFQLQYYFRHLMKFHFQGSDVFSDIDHANNFLDLPFDEVSLKKKKELIDLALKYVSG